MTLASNCGTINTCTFWTSEYTFLFVKILQLKKIFIVIVGIIRRKNKKQLSILKIFQIKFKFFTIIFESYSNQYLEQSCSGKYDLYLFICH